MFIFQFQQKCHLELKKLEHNLEILEGGPDILSYQFSYLGLLRMRASILHPFSHREQQYLMYLHYCKGKFKVVVGVHINKT